MLRRLRHRMKAFVWKRLGSVPGAAGATAAKWIAIEGAVRGARGMGFGADAAGIDERVVEYGWIFDRLAELDRPGGHVLDAGSVMNHRPVLDLWRDAGRSALSIVTLAHEGHAHHSTGVRYEYADLRQLPYRDGWFSTVICISTLEHVGLDTAIYGATAATGADPNAEARRALRELFRVAREGATLLLSVPFGVRSNRGWLRVLDDGDLAVVLHDCGWNPVDRRYFRARSGGWRECAVDEARDAGYNEPVERAGGARTAPPWVAAAEAVTLIELKRS